MEYLILIIIGIVILSITMKRKSRIVVQGHKNEEYRSEVENDNKSKVDETTTIISCRNSSCKQRLRIPVTEKILEVTCPKCRNIFYYPDAKKATTEKVSIVIETANKNYDAYLDIETTGFSPYNGELTVIGLCLDDDNEPRVIQLVEDKISAPKLLKIFENVKVLYTYNGTSFDLPYIKTKLGIDLTKYCIHKDLMYECWQRNLYGGFKEVERKLGIKRKITDVDGRIAVKLWSNYKFYGDRKSLTTLLEYNREDVLNLRALRQKLNI